MQIDAADSYYIGDTFETDIMGAHSAGWHSIWFNHRKRSMPEVDFRPDYEVGSIEELRALLESKLAE